MLQLIGRHICIRLSGDSMKTVKCKVLVYDCKKHREKVVEKELPVYEEPKPVPSKYDIQIKKICEDIASIKRAVEEIAKKVNVEVELGNNAESILSGISRLFGK